VSQDKKQAPILKFWKLESDELRVMGPRRGERLAIYSCLVQVGGEACGTNRQIWHKDGKAANLRPAQALRRRVDGLRRAQGCKRRGWRLGLGWVVCCVRFAVARVRRAGPGHVSACGAWGVEGILGGPLPRDGEVGGWAG
jgi:hypothetical protein